ncbi:PREDICTED: reverse mRNAase [Prunus dulcis]|uniref:PREDICTED: reverse mRNAase n=1 Tax=Prunus dulcis TaxID=3755 RepID=A0A5E4GHT2_PRUDU|nr:PREDICTED: reverse mRNAase [Prunus dulcis]
MAGLRWCIGDGKSVHVTRDPWLPMPYHFKVRTPSPLLPEKDVQTVCHVFNKEEADSILAMALSRFGCPNHLMWHFTKNGLYTVKSGYRVAVELDSNGLLGRRGGGGTSVDRGGRRLWKSIWGLNVASKIRHFVSGDDVGTI